MKNIRRNTFEYNHEDMRANCMDQRNEARELVDKHLMATEAAAN